MTSEACGLIFLCVASGSAIQLCFKLRYFIHVLDALGGYSHVLFISGWAPHTFAFVMRISGKYRLLMFKFISQASEVYTFGSRVDTWLQLLGTYMEPRLYGEKASKFQARCARALLWLFFSNHLIISWHNSFRTCFHLDSGARSNALSLFGRTHQKQAFHTLRKALL